MVHQIFQFYSTWQLMCLLLETLFPWWTFIPIFFQFSSYMYICSSSTTTYCVLCFMSVCTLYELQHPWCLTWQNHFKDAYTAASISFAVSLQQWKLDWLRIKGVWDVDGHLTFESFLWSKHILCLLFAFILAVKYTCTYTMLHVHKRLARNVTIHTTSI